jgi:hypothetical protein
MSRADQHKPAGKQSRRSRKPEQRNKEPDQPKSATPDQEQEAKDEISAAAEPSDAAAIGAVPTSEPVSVNFLDQQQDPTEHSGATAGPGDDNAVGAPQASDPVPTSFGNQLQEANQQIGALAERTSVAVIDAAPDTVPISVQAIATAYGDYTRKSLEQTRVFVERLARVRSLDKAVEVQIEFAKQAYETFVTEMQKICGLQNQLARQSLKPLERFAAKSAREAR